MRGSALSSLAVCGLLAACAPSKDDSDEGGQTNGSNDGTSIDESGLRCADPQGLFQFEEVGDSHELGTDPAGYVHCAGGAFDRIEPMACTWDYQVPPCNPENGGECSADTGCPDGAKCRDSVEGCVCTLVCHSDADCADDEACICASRTADGWGFHYRNECMPARCRSSEDCDGYACGVAEDECGQMVGLFCRTARDLCYEDDDCDPSSEHCGWEGHWNCMNRAICE